MTEPLTEAQAKTYLRLEDDDPGISDLPALITAARQSVERYLNASIVVQERVLELDQFPAWTIPLPLGPVRSITKIEYLDSNGATQEVANWVLSKDRLTPAYGENWPATRGQLGAVTITYEAGMMTGASPDVLENEALNTSIRLELVNVWDQRGVVMTGGSVAINPTSKRYAEPYRLDMGV